MSAGGRGGAAAQCLHINYKDLKGVNKITKNVCGNFINKSRVKFPLLLTMYISHWRKLMMLTQRCIKQSKDMWLID